MPNPDNLLIKTKEVSMKPKPKIILWDIETALMPVYVFGLNHNDYIPFDNIKEEWFIICGSWMELGDRKAKSVDVTLDKKRFKKNHKDDYIVVKKLREVLVDADLIIAHFGDKFDLPKLNARLIYHGLEPLPPIKTLDTKKESARIAKFTSNKLDYLAQFFGLGKKIDTDSELWRQCTEGNIKAIKKMVYYNRIDVEILKKVYLKLRKYFRNNPELFTDGREVCPTCGSHNIQKSGTRRTRTMRYQRYQCQNCGQWFRERTSTLGGDKPKFVSI